MVNLCIAHKCVAFTFISIKFREVLKEKYVEIDSNPIQAPNIFCAGYLLGLAPSVAGKHWYNIYLNKHLKLETIDIDVKNELVKSS